MDLKQYLFYVTAHRYVATPLQFRIVALAPFLIISAGITLLVFILPGFGNGVFLSFYLCILQCVQEILLFLIFTF